MTSKELEIKSKTQEVDIEQGVANSDINITSNENSKENHNSSYKKFLIFMLLVKVFGLGEKLFLLWQQVIFFMLCLSMLHR
jgi:hypothetical protein